MITPHTPEPNANYPFGVLSYSENAPWNEPETHTCRECCHYEAPPFVNADSFGACTWEGSAFVGGVYWVLGEDDACEGWKE